MAATAVSLRAFLISCGSGRPRVPRRCERLRRRACSRMQRDARVTEGECACMVQEVAGCITTIRIWQDGQERGIVT